MPRSHSRPEIGEVPASGATEWSVRLFRAVQVTGLIGGVEAPAAEKQSGSLSNRYSSVRDASDAPHSGPDLSVAVEVGTQCSEAVNEPMTARLETFFNHLLGLDLDATELAFEQMAWRGFVVFCFAVVIVRLGARRLLAHSAGFDIMVAIVLGSVLSRAINGQAAFLPTLGVSALLVALHHVMATLAFHSHWISERLKGRARILVRDGQINRDEMARSKITDDDLDENLRLHGNVRKLSEVAEARLERNGAVSVVKTRAEECE